MNSMLFPPGPPPGQPPHWFPIFQPDPLLNSSFWESGNIHNHLRNVQDTIKLAKAVRQELEAIAQIGEAKDNVVKSESSDTSVLKLSKVLKDKKINLKLQETLSLEAANSLLSTLKSQLEPFNVLTSETSSWEEKSAAIRLANKIQKHKRNKRWRKRKRKHNAEIHAKEQERFDQADQEADEWRTREIAKDIARRKVEKMKEIAKLKANEERERLESELELVLIVEKLQELRSLRIQKLKKQGHFLPDEDDKFLERVRAAVEEEERQAAAAADTDATKDAIATAEEFRKTIQGGGSESKDVTVYKDEGISNLSTVTETVGGKDSGVAAEPELEQQQLEGRGNNGTYDSVPSLPLEFYHYYHGSNTDMGTLIERLRWWFCSDGAAWFYTRSLLAVRRTWDAYIRPGGSRIPGHWVQPPSPASDVWASYLVGSSTNEAS